MREGDFTHPSYTARADETLSGVLLGVFCDFMEGDFQMLRTFLRECFSLFRIVPRFFRFSCHPAFVRLLFSAPLFCARAFTCHLGESWQAGGRADVFVYGSN